MPIAPLNLVPTAAPDNAFDFSPLARLGQQLAPKDNSLASLGDRATPDVWQGGTAPVSYTGGSDRFGRAIAGIESGGKYDLTGPVTKSGDRAYGKYQIMGNNIPDWSRAALGTAMTPQQFLADPNAQEAVFKHRFGQYVDKYGPTGAAKAWFAGEGGMNNPNASDLYGTTVASYARRFNAGLGE
jgi:hypothetical protein